MFRLARIAGKGRGLLARGRIGAGTVVERAPAVRLSAAERRLVDQTALFPYCFADPDAFAGPAAGEGTDSHDGFFVFGSLTFCNHAADPNAAVRWLTDDIGFWALLEARRDIADGEEITLFYTNIADYAAEDFLF